MKRTLDKRGRAFYQPITLSDFQEFYKDTHPPVTIRGYSFFLDDDLVAISGVRNEGGGCFIAFSDMKEGVIVKKATIWRAALVVMNMIDEMHVPVFAFVNPALDTAPRFLTRLGFVMVSDGVYRREAR